MLIYIVNCPYICLYVCLTPKYQVRLCINISNLDEGNYPNLLANDRYGWVTDFVGCS